MPVQIKLGARGKGQLTIQFASNDALDGVLARLRDPIAGRHVA
jgi:ParB family chromosome partitioning protein